MKKRLLPLMLALVLCLGLTVPAMAAETTLEETIPCDYGNVGGFFEGLAWVEGEEHFGFMDKTGTVVIPCEYDDVRNFSAGLAAVQQKGKWGFIDKTGKAVIPCKYEAALDFSEGVAGVMLNGKAGYIDPTGKEVIPFTYDNLDNFSEGLAPVSQKEKWGYIDQTGKEIIPCKYDEAGSFSEGLARVVKNGKRGFVNKEGEEVIPCEYDGAGDFSGGLAGVKQNDKWGFIDKTGETIIPFQYDNIADFSEGLALVLQNDKWGYIDQTGKEVIPFKYDDAWGFFEGFAPVMQDGKWGYIDKTGKEVVSLKYDKADTIADGMARVAQAHAVSGADVTLYTYGYLSISGGEEGTPAPVEPEKPQEVTVTASVSDWAKEQVDSAAANGLIADGLGDDYTRNITRAQFAAVSVKLYEAMSGQTAPSAGDSPFTDTSDPAVIQAEVLGFVGGVGDGKFEPDSLVTREQAATMLSRVYTKLGGEIPTVDATTFADNDDVSDYAKDAVAFMADKEIVGGVGSNQFDPQGNASIEQALVIALRMFEKLK